MSASSSFTYLTNTSYLKATHQSQWLHVLHHSATAALDAEAFQEVEQAFDPHPVAVGEVTLKVKNHIGR